MWILFSFTMKVFFLALVLLSFFRDIFLIGLTVWLSDLESGNVVQLTIIYIRTEQIILPETNTPRDSHNFII